MEELQRAWNGKFGPGVKPPEWVFNFSAEDVTEQRQNVERKITESVDRIETLREELDQELFLLAWLKGVRENVISSVGLVEADQVCKENHVLSDTEQVFEEEEALNGSPKVPIESDTAEKLVQSEVGTPDRARGKTATASNSEDSPNSSEYHTAGLSSSSPEVSLTNLAEEASSPSRPSRQRSIRTVSTKESLVAKEVRQRIVDNRLCRSCEILSERQESELSKSLPVGSGRHRRNSSAPSINLADPPQDKKEVKVSDLAPSSESSTTNASVSSGQTEQSPPSNTDTGGRVVLREKVVRRPSLPMSCEEAMNQWRGTGGASSERANRSSNGVSCEPDYTFMVNNDEDSDPALINIMATRLRSLRTSRSSISTDDTPTGKQVANGGRRGTDMVSPLEDSTFPDVEGAGGVSAKYAAPLCKRSSTHDSSPVKRERVSFHYSDDECLTPKMDSGDHTFSNSPSSNKCSHRNSRSSNASRSSNGIIDEEMPYDLTLRKDRSDLDDFKLERKNTITPVGPAVATSEEKMDVTATLTPHIGYSAGSLFDERSDSFSQLEGLKLGDLDIDVELTLSKLRNQPDMSMATLLDANENRRMNADLSKDSDSEDFEYGESIEIDEATISAFTLSNDMYNSANSIPGLFTEHSGTSPLEQDSPTHSAHQGVNLRPKRLNRKKIGNLDLEMMAGGPSSDNDDMSRSSTSLTSEEESISTSPINDENLVSVCMCVCVLSS